MDLISPASSWKSWLARPDWGERALLLMPDLAAIRLPLRVDTARGPSRRSGEASRRFGSEFARCISAVQCVYR
jgi:hypothetical protein